MKKRAARSFDEHWWKRQFSNLVKIANDPAKELVLNQHVRKELPETLSLPFKNGKVRPVYSLLSLQLENLAHMPRLRGGVAVGTGEPGGWVEIHRSLLYVQWSTRLRHAYLSADQVWDRDISAAALLKEPEAIAFCHAIAIGDNSFVHSLGRHLFANFRKTGGGHPEFFYLYPFVVFTLKLYSIWVGEEIVLRPEIKNPLGRYQQVFDCWNSPADMGTAIFDLCNNHCEHVYETGGEFAFPPYNLFPVEILALYRVRQLLGLETPPVEHVLLRGPLATPPTEIPVVEDALLDLVVARFRRDFPDGRDFF